jgi:hypothetical protein
VALEVAGEMRLVVEADVQGDLGWRLAAQEPFAGLFDAGSGDIGVRSDSELPGETADKVGDGPVEQPGGVGERDLGGAAPVEEGAKLPGEALLGRWDSGGARIEALAEPFGDDGQPGFDIELVGPGETGVEMANGGAQLAVAESGGIHGGADEPGGQEAAVEVELALAELATA